MLESSGVIFIEISPLLCPFNTVRDRPLLGYSGNCRKASYRISGQSCELGEYDEQLVRRLIEKMTVFDEKLTVEFKSGVEFDIGI